MRHSRSELIAVLNRVVSGVTVVADGYASETALATAVVAEPRVLRALRREGVVAPSRQGRGWVYGAEEARSGAAAAALVRLGAEVPEIAEFFGEDWCSPDCPVRRRPGDCSAERCCAAFLAMLKQRTEAQIADLRVFGSLLDQFSSGVVVRFPAR